MELLKRYRIYISLFVVLLALIGVLNARASDPTRLRVVDEVLQAIVYPFEVSFHKVSGGISALFSRYVYLVNLKQENEQLKLQVQALQEQVNHDINSAIQFDVLREQLQFMEEPPEGKVFAEVIGESLDNLHQVLLINKGSLAGIRRNFPVILREGVVGRIQSVTALQAVVQLMVDRRHRFPVLVERSREKMTGRGDGSGIEMLAQDRGIVYGTGQELRMTRIRMLADVQPGDRVITSGLGGVFPKGLLVGTVTKISRERHELFQTAEIRPAVDFRKIEGVFVVVKDRTDGSHPLFSGP
ncbi:MAG: rod shape-determining protein MreC [Candidatus Lambdaproteobacteria bacterium]|nr:rod shape-determining protein MreC [Candidatus Lambdaproteobacteria bacterium]